MKSSTFRIGRILAPTLLSVVAHAQTPPPVDAGKVLQETRPTLPQAPRKAPEPVIQQQEAAPLVLPAGQTLMVKAFRFEGADFLGEAELQAAVADYLGRALTMAEIEAAADRVTALCRSHGYMVARAYVPKQDASSGTLIIRVVAGKYGKVSLQNKSLVRDALIGGYFAGLAGDKAVTRDDIERAMLLVGSLPGASLPKVSIAPGSAPETSDFDIEIQPGARFNGYLLGDNYGSRYTGRNRISLGASLNSPLALGDKLDFSGMGSDNGNLLNGRLAYSAPLGTSGLRGELAVTNSTYKLGDIYTPLDAKGAASSVEASFSYPIERSRAQNLTASLGLVGRNLRDEVLSADAGNQVTTKKAYAATLGLMHERYGQMFGRDAYFSATGSLTWGHLDIDEAAMKANNRAGANTVGDYGRANISLLGRLALTETLTTSATLSAQQALNRNLDSSEQLMISGTRDVISYEQTVSGDSGYLANVELRYALPNLAGTQHSVSVFADAGHINLYDASYTKTNKVNLSDAGLGYTLSWNSLFLRAQAAYALGNWPASVLKDDHTRFLLQAGMVF
ncbi:ShlB/FhaC/HecB family hemolysin secretion/activation protein [Chitinivorax sp. PXF-14]|uniref:ShlB/FhaC/HecB family hemolysin secretion/activation protein n=1 Tax=Chitinivorax sp. PXF-14 TaxID=3230488 RepID=UPI003466E670